MTNASSSIQSLVDRAKGNATAAGELFGLHRDRLRRMIQARLDDRLRGRVDPSDVLQESFLEFADALPNYKITPDVPFYVWLRCITVRKLHALHRKHLGTRMRDAAREIALGTAAPQASSVFLAAHLVGALTTPSEALLRNEVQEQIRRALEQLTDTDREVLALRHYEQLTNQEAACVLGLSEAAASVRFIRALRHLKDAVKHIPGVLDNSGEANGTH